MILSAKEFLSIALQRFLSFVAGFVPLRRRLIVFCNYNGRGYGDSLGPIADELLRRGVNCSMVWLVNDLNVSIPASIKKVKRGRFVERIYLAMAKIVISNTKGGLVYSKKRCAYYIQTWHGDMPFKHIEAECGKILPAYYTWLSKFDSCKTDFFISGSSLLSDIARRAFWYLQTCKICEYGNPRKDVFFRTSEAKMREFKQNMFGGASVRVALYAPTFRSNIPNEACRIDANALQKSLVEKFGGQWIVVIRLHPNVANRSDMFTYDDQIVNGTKIDDGQLLSMAAELLISDYSSVIEDFVIQRKPVFLYTPDINEYQTKERKLRDLYFKLPFPRCETECNLRKAIVDFDDKAYQTALGDFVECDYRVFDDGHASERVVDLIEKLMA